MIVSATAYSLSKAAPERAMPAAASTADTSVEDATPDPRWTMLDNFMESAAQKPQRRLPRTGSSTSRTR